MHVIYVYAQESLDLTATYPGPTRQQQAKHNKDMVRIDVLIFNQCDTIIVILAVLKLFICILISTYLSKMKQNYVYIKVCSNRFNYSILCN